MNVETGVVKPVWESEDGSKGFYVVCNKTKLHITFQTYPDGGVYVCVDDDKNSCVQFEIPK